MLYWFINFEIRPNILHTKAIISPLILNSNNFDPLSIVNVRHQNTCFQGCLFIHSQTKRIEIFNRRIVNSSQLLRAHTRIHVLSTYQNNYPLLSKWYQSFVTFFLRNTHTHSSMRTNEKKNNNLSTRKPMILWFFSLVEFRFPKHM